MKRLQEGICALDHMIWTLKIKWGACEKGVAEGKNNIDFNISLGSYNKISLIEWFKKHINLFPIVL